MHSPIQRWLSDPTNPRWEQPSYASLQGLCAASAQLRKRQALDLWNNDVLAMGQRIKPLAWARLYAGIAGTLSQGLPDEFRFRADAPPTYRWLRRMSMRLPQQRHDRAIFDQHSLALLKVLGHENVLSRVLVEHHTLPEEQLDFWRQAFPMDSMHEKMGIALAVGAVRRPTLDGYLRARSRLSVEETHDNVDLSILAD